MSLDIKAEPILQTMLKRGGQLAELFLEESFGLTVVMDDDKIEKVLSGVERGAGLRLIHELHTAYAYSNNLNQQSLLSLARNLSALSAGQATTPRPLRLLHPGWADRMIKPPRHVATVAKVELVRAVNAAARDVDSRVRQVRVMYLDKVQEVRIVNSLGQEAYEQRVQSLLAVHCVAAEGAVVQTGYETTGGAQGFELFEAEDPTEVARKAARRAVMMLAARPAPGGSMPVVLAASAGGTMVHEAVGHGLEADLVLEGMSVYAGKIGQVVASPLVTVIDDATVPGRRGSSGFDDEGTPSRRNLLIEKGVLKSYMQDRLSSLKLGTEPTGNGRRESYRFRPIPRMTNTMIVPGEDAPQDIIADTESGLLISKMGGGQVNTTNGDFVFEVAEGYLIKNGQVDKPVRGATLTGNGPQALMDIDRVAGDLGYSLGTCGKDGQGLPVADAQPTLRITRMVVGGLQQ
jgi:TldD protein